MNQLHDNPNSFLISYSWMKQLEPLIWPYLEKGKREGEAM